MADIVGYPVVSAKLDLRQGIFEGNRKAWDEVLRKYQDALQQVSSEGDESSQRRHQGRGQLLELAPFAGHGLDSTASASLVTGIGKVSGRACMIIASIPSIKGGAWNEFTSTTAVLLPNHERMNTTKLTLGTVLKHNRVTEIATENGLPIIGMVQAAGAYLPQQFRVFHRAGQMFRDLARRTQAGLQSCSVVFGSSTAGGAYLPGLSDYTIFVRNKAQVFLGGPPLVKMATGETIDAETLGGAEMHATVTGLADQIASDEFDAIRKAREWAKSLDVRYRFDRSRRAPLDPRYPADDLLALVNPDVRKPFDMSEVVLRLVDDSRMAIFKPTYGKNLLTCWAEIHGHHIGIIGNQTPVIHPDEASKGAQFIRLCNQRNIPIVYLHNVTGFMVGSRAEKEGMIKKGAQFVSAVSCSQVPQISVILGSSYGAGNYAMCGRPYNPRFLFSWPNSRCSVMGPDQLAGVMDIVTQGSKVRKAQEGISNGTIKNPAAPVAADRSVTTFRDQVERESESYYTSANLIDDGIIDPRDTRDVLGICLEVVKIPEVKGAQNLQNTARL